MTTLPTAAITGPGTRAEAISRAAYTLVGHSDSPRLDAELLLCKVLGLSRSALIVHGAERIAVASIHAYDGLIARRRRGIPIAYLTGMREFWSLELAVTPDVLVPRPETEVLVEQALDLLPENRMQTVLDLGTGSGAIALAIASERPRARITGADVSDKAIAVAIANADKLGLRIDWRLGSWFDAVQGERFDVIVANPPYIACGDSALARLAAEPALALTPGSTGLEALGQIVGSAARHLNPRGWLVLEHGSTQADDVAKMLEREGFGDVRSRLDYSGKPRVTLGSLQSSHWHS